MDSNHSIIPSCHPPAHFSSPSHELPSMRNKRSSSSSSLSLDCQSLQSSLKRVRLSCSPGELRLQRDLRFLQAMGWQTDGDQDNKDMNMPYLLDSNPRWYYQGHDVMAELQLLDPLRLVLSIQHPQRSSRLWIQIPRMYPHRPPVIPRIENMAMEQIVIEEEPPGMPQGQDTASEVTTGSTVFYKEWSPVRQLGDLLVFLLHTSAQQPTISRSTSFGTSTTLSFDSTSSRTPCTVPMTTESQSSSPSPTHVTLTETMTTAHSRPGSLSYFVDEHKMDDVGVCYKHNHIEHVHDIDHDDDIACQVLLPNRFDVGYGKYCNPLERRPRIPQQQDPNAMEL